MGREGRMGRRGSNDGRKGRKIRGEWGWMKGGGRDEEMDIGRVMEELEPEREGWKGEGG